MTFEINSVGFSADAKLESFIKEKITKLEKYYNRIIKASVYLKLENSGQVKDKVVEITLTVPKKILVSKNESKIFEVAVDECVESLERQLKKYKETTLK